MTCRDTTHHTIGFEYYRTGIGTPTGIRNLPDNKSITDPGMGVRAWTALSAFVLIIALIAAWAALEVRRIDDLAPPTYSTGLHVDWRSRRADASRPRSVAVLGASGMAGHELLRNLQKGATDARSPTRVERIVLLVRSPGGFCD